MTGDLRSNAELHAQTYDVDLQEAVRHFETRHGLPDSRVLTRAVVAAMNVPVAMRIRQIELNMERWRWFPRDLGPVHISVNVPEYHLDLWDHGRVALAMNVVVGAVDKPTPIFSDTMTTVAFAPYWNVPDSIANDETLPEVVSDPDYLVRNNIEVVSTSGQVIDPATIDWSQAQEEEGFPYRFRQRPGTANSLGRVKFLFPNDFDVYLHDTPHKELFSASKRATSSGCIRVENVHELAVLLLDDPVNWSREKLQEAIDTRETRKVHLSRGVPILLAYWTVQVDQDGFVSFRPDIYHRDEPLLQALDTEL